MAGRLQSEQVADISPECPADIIGICKYPKGIVISDAEMAAINIKRAEFHGEWNYTISPDAHPPNRAFIS